MGTNNIDIDDPQFQQKVTELMSQLNLDRKAAEFIAAAQFGGHGDVVFVNEDGEEFSPFNATALPDWWRPGTGYSAYVKDPSTPEASAANIDTQTETRSP